MTIRRDCSIIAREGQGQMTFDVGSVIHDRYRVVRKLGEGGMGAVYEVEHVQLARRLALKTLHPELVRNADLVARFQREARAAAAVGSQHIVDVVDLGTADGSPFIVMEYLDGPSLRALLEEHGQLQVSRALGIVTQCCKALAAAHAKGIVHRDLKPDNIIVLERDGDDFVKIVDFGIAKLVEDSIALDAVATTRTGISMGTPQYMSPEQLAGQSDIDARADVWAMGCVLFELLTGRPPFDAPTVPLLSVRILSQPTPGVRETRPAIPARLDEVIQRALAKERGDRYPSTTAMGTALDALKMTPAATTRRPVLAGDFDDEATRVDTSPAGAPTGPARITATPQAWDTESTVPPRRWSIGPWLALGAVTLLGLGAAIGLVVTFARSDDHARTMAFGEGDQPAATATPPSASSTPVVTPIPTAPTLAPAPTATMPPETPTDAQQPAPAAALSRLTTGTRREARRALSGAGLQRAPDSARPSLVPATPPVPTTPPPRPMAGRRLTIRNLRQLAAAVTLTCGDAPTISTRIPAGGTRTVSVADGACRVRCDDGVTVGSLCGTRIAATASSLVIR